MMHLMRMAMYLFVLKRVVLTSLVKKEPSRRKMHPLML